MVGTMSVPSLKVTGVAIAGAVSDVDKLMSVTVAWVL